MCGIIGAIGPTERITESMLNAGLDAMSHRGQDGRGIQDVRLQGQPSRKLLLGHRRLAILDLSDRGAQPMRDPESGNWITYNGEIYNYKTLQGRLSACGARFRSNTDTEVLLSSYSREGLRPCLTEVAGMFAFGIWNEDKQQLVLARDHVGIKPLYYYSQNGIFLFASEVRALLATGLVPRRLDPEALEGYLEFGSVQGSRTFVKDVHALPPAHYMIVSADGSMSAPESYWRPDFRAEPESIRADGQVIKGLRDLLETVIEEHLVSDVPLGAFLSGGLDSSSIVSLMAKYAPGRVRSYSVVFKERGFSEALYSRQMSAHAGTEHEEILVSQAEFIHDIPNFLKAMDQPSVDGPNVFLISGAVKKAGVKVALSGQGGDEVFAGYSSFFRLRRLSHIQSLVRYLPNRGREFAASLATVFVSGNSRWARVPDLIRCSASLSKSYGVIHAISSKSLRTSLISTKVARATALNHSNDDRYAQLEQALGHCGVVNLTSALELGNYLPNTLLRDGDVLSMAHTIEIRVPFLDRRIIDYVAPIRGEDKVSSAFPKPLLVRALMDLLPPDIYRRRKQGFTFPWGSWLRGTLRPAVEAVLDSPDCGVQLGLEPGACQKLWRLFLADIRVPWTVIWSLYTLVEWCSQHEVSLTCNN